MIFGLASSPAKGLKKTSLQNVPHEIKLDLRLHIFKFIIGDEILKLLCFQIEKLSNTITQNR